MSTLTHSPATTLHATWLHPVSGPEALDPNMGDNPRWSWALSVTSPRTEPAQQAAGWLCGLDAQGVTLVNFGYDEFALYRLVDECRHDVAAGIPNEEAEAVLRRLGQNYGPGSVRLCGAYVLISAENPLLAPKVPTL